MKKLAFTLLMALVGFVSYGQTTADSLITQEPCGLKINLPRGNCKGCEVIISDGMTGDTLKTFPAHLPKRFYLDVLFLKPGYYVVGISDGEYVIYEKMFRRKG